jgi:dihydropteroate synthase
VKEVAGFFSERLGQLIALGIPVEHVILDVGIGFGKSPEHNLRLLGALNTFKTWQRPLLLGVSRKSFIGQITGAREVASRLPGSLACACWGIEHGANIIRTHDVAATRRAVRMWEAIQVHNK